MLPDYRKIEQLQQSVTEATSQTEKVQDLLKSTEESHSEELSSIKSQSEKTTSQLKDELQRLVCD